MEKFPRGCKVCFIGDSLTAQNYILSYIIDFYNNNFPNHNIEFINCGTAGGTASYALASIEDEVYVHNPDYAVIAFGVNDSLRWALEKPPSLERYQEMINAYEIYKQKMKALCDVLEERGIKIILCTPAPYAEYQKNGENAYKGGYALMQGYADFVRSLAKERNIPLCDYHSYITAILQSEDTLYNADCVHPTPHGYFYMAKCFLNFQGLDIGQEHCLPEYFSAWNEELRKLRCLSAAECMIIVDYSLSIEEKISKLERYIASNTPKMPWFVELSKNYIKHYDEKKALIKSIHEIYVNDVMR